MLYNDSRPDVIKMNMPDIFEILTSIIAEGDVISLRNLLLNKQCSPNECDEVNIIKVHVINFGHKVYSFPLIILCWKLLTIATLSRVTYFAK